MRILMVDSTDAVWPVHFARYFIARGDDFLIASFCPDRYEGVPMEYIGPRRYVSGGIKHMFVLSAPRIRSIAGRFRPDIVFATSMASNGLAAALSFKSPLVVSAIGSDVLNRKKRGMVIGRARKEVVRFASRRADIVNAVSQELADELVRLGVPPSKILNLPFGVDTGVFHPAIEMPRDPAANLLCTRRHEPVYDIPTVINALAILHAAGVGFHCTFTAGGSLLETHRELARKKGLEAVTTFTGTVPLEDLPLHYRRADVYISASLADGTSVSLLEAMASGLFPVMSRIRANEPWISHGRTGLMFEAGHPETLAAELKRALSDSALRGKALGENLARVRRDGSLHGNMERLADIFERLIAGQRPDCRKLQTPFAAPASQTFPGKADFSG